MATSGFWQDPSAVDTSDACELHTADGSSRVESGKAGLWMALDAVTVLVAAVLVDVLGTRLAPAIAVPHLLEDGPDGVFVALMTGFVLGLIFISRKLQLYAPTRLGGFFHEQWLNAQACVSAGLLLAGAVYVLQVPEMPREFVLGLAALVFVFLGLRRLACRVFLYRRFERDLDTRNVLIVGTGPEAQALRHHLQSQPRLGYRFKGYIELPGAHGPSGADPDDVLGELDTIAENARRHFIDEIFLVTPCDRGLLQQMLAEARKHNLDLRVLPDLYDGLVWERPVEHLGQFPTIPLHRASMHEVGLAIKRLFDIAFSMFAVILSAPLMTAIACAIKIDSPGPVFYFSERIGKKGRVFRCTKFRTMICDAEKRRSAVMHMNQREGILFKAANDPRVTRVGRLLRKYSLDELPQFLNVLRGDMSVVGPRPPIPSEVSEYKLNDLRRLDVTPGITGLWQVQGRQDPSFDRYVSLDMRYIEDWSLWLDLKIIARTVGVVFAGTGC